jgi:hypothetical protein
MEETVTSLFSIASTVPKRGGGLIFPLQEAFSEISKKSDFIITTPLRTFINTQK